MIDDLRLIDWCFNFKTWLKWQFIYWKCWCSNRWTNKNTESVIELINDCTSGCVDRHASCAVWRSQNFCASRRIWMSENCQRSCGWCGISKQRLCQATAGRRRWEREVRLMLEHRDCRYPSHQAGESSKPKLIVHATTKNECEKRQMFNVSIIA